jgi:sterol desaturase/sphingolipid hydroxylase (fatty acid hydroxylase superfamily)
MNTIARILDPERRTNLALGLLRVAGDLSTRGLLFGLYEVVLRASGASARQPLAAWLVGLLAYDFLYYWAHRAQHRIGVFWTVHAVHHQARRFDVTVGLGVGVLDGLLLFPFSLPLAFLGISTSVYAGVTLAHAVLMTWLHTECIPELGFLERVLNTPALHRVHHSRNPAHADRNFGGILSIWDLAFGTYAPPEPVSGYGVIGASDPVGVFEAHIAPFREMRSSLAKARTTRARLAVLFGAGDLPPPRHRSIHVLAVSAAALSILVALRTHPVSVSDLVLFALPALVVADLLSGVLHWFMDELAPRLGALGKRLSVEFRDHHVAPERCREVGLWNSAFTGALILLPAALAFAASQGRRVPAFAALVLTILLVTPEIHKWAHRARGSRFIEPLQRAGLLISPEAHAEHHRIERHAYCVVTGWWNPVLDYVGVWRMLAGRHGGAPSP